MWALCVESSHARGMGHLFRALIVAERLHARALPHCVVVNPHAPAEAVLRERGVPHRVVEPRPGWQRAVLAELRPAVWIDDRLDTDAEHAALVAAAGVRRITFDDGGSGAASADLHVAALAGEGEAIPGRRVLRGPDYLVLTPEIDLHRRRRSAQGSLLVTLGGSDTWGLTVLVVALLRDRHARATVVVGPGFRHDRELAEVFPPGWTLHRAVPSLVAEMARHDWAVTAGGLTALEAAASGLPPVVIAAEDFEERVGRLVAGWGMGRFAGHRDRIDRAALLAPLDVAEASAAGLARLHTRGADLVVDAIASL